MATGLHIRLPIGVRCLLAVASVALISSQSHAQDQATTVCKPPPVLRYTEMTSPDHSYIFGDFTICPVEPDVPGHMRSVCVTAARNLVVQNLNTSRPPFRIRSTWSPNGPDNRK